MGCSGCTNGINTRAIGRALIGCDYSYIRVQPDEFVLISVGQNNSFQKKSVGQNTNI